MSHTQSALPITTPVFTDDQMKAARDALLMWNSLPSNPIAVAGVLHRAIKAEFDATGNMSQCYVGPVVIIQWALNFTLTRDQTPADIVVLMEAVRECERRVENNA